MGQFRMKLSLSLSLFLSLQGNGCVGALDRAVHSSRAQRGSYSAVFVHQSLSESGEVTAAACARFGTLAEEFALRAGTKSQKSVPQYVYSINPLWSFDF